MCTCLHHSCCLFNWQSWMPGERKKKKKEKSNNLLAELRPKPQPSRFPFFWAYTRRLTTRTPTSRCKHLKLSVCAEAALLPALAADRANRHYTQPKTAAPRCVPPGRPLSPQRCCPELSAGALRVQTAASIWTICWDAGL